MAARHKRAMTALDPLMAGFAGGAAAFLIYAMPGAQFDRMVSLSGLPMILSAAQPPLGLTARLAVMAAAGIGSFILIFLVLRALGKPAPQPKRRSGPVEIEMAPPKLRRADAHPDAPARRPILAGIDLGKSFDEIGNEEDLESETRDEFGFEQDAEMAADDEPFDTAPVFEDVPAKELAEPASPFGFAADEEAAQPATIISPEDELDQQLDDEAAPFGYAAFADASTGASLEDQGSEPGEDDEFDFAPMADQDDELNSIAASAEDEAAGAVEDDGSVFGHAPSAEDAPNCATSNSAMDVDGAKFPPEDVQSVAVRQPRPLTVAGELVRTASDPVEPDSIHSLVARLEAGLQRRQPARSAAVMPEPRKRSAPAPLDQRLRGAIDELQKLAGRGN